MDTREETQRRYEQAYFDRMERDRPRPTHELGQLRRIAERARSDAGAMLEFATVCTPQTFLLALAADEWDRRNPFYSCVHCHDGKALPDGYMCQVCGAES